MNELIILSLQGRASTLEEEQLRVWRQASLVNEGRYREVARLWALTALAEPSAMSRPSAQDVIEGAETRRSPLAIGRFLPVSWSRTAAGVAAAAVVVLGVSLSVLRPREGAQEARFGASEFSTGANEMATVELLDGSLVRLAPQSRLRLLGKAGQREVWLEGRAFFGVSRRAGDPFLVRSRLGEVSVLGTRFDMGVEADHLRLVVVEGRVAVSAGPARFELGPGEMSVVASGDKPSTVKLEDVSQVLAWMGRTLVFQETPLSQVAAEIERRYDVRIELPDPALATRTVTAWFGDESFEEVVTVVCRVVAVRCSIGDRRATIGARDPIPAS